ncbi:MAG: PspC domain-containing protein, partial [Chloroflexota bacterium]
MKRSFSNRLFGGVCGGLSESLPLNAWVWRVLFIALTLGTLGVGALVYLLMWWLLPLDSPLHERGSALAGLLSIALGIVLVGLWFGRESVGIAGNYWSVALTIVAGVFLLKQALTGRWQNIAFGLAVLFVPVAFVLRDFDLLQAGAIDIVLRSLPAVIIFFGLMILLRYRVRFGSWIALIISVGLVAGLVNFAITSRVDVVSEDNTVELVIPNQADHDQVSISDNVTTLLIDVRTLDTDIRVSVGAPNSRTITGTFTGSNNSEIDPQYGEDGDIASFSIIETQASDFPALQDIGRATLNLELPPNIALGLTFNGQRARTTSFDMGEINLERLNITLNEGDVFVRLPAYQPQSPTIITDGSGVWTVRDGNLRVAVPDELGVRFALARAGNNEPSNFDNLVYQLLIEGDDYVLATRQFDARDAQMSYRFELNRNRLEVENVNAPVTPVDDADGTDNDMNDEDTDSTNSEDNTDSTNQDSD